MAPTLTLHQCKGRRRATVGEHPVEIARKAVIAAAEVETDEWAEVMRRFASALPQRRPIVQVEGDD